MKKGLLVLAILYLFHSDLLAQENKIKELYTDITTKINSVLLTRQSSLEFSGFAMYNRFSTEFTNDERISQRSIRIEPAVSYFIIDNVSLGLSVSYHSEETEYDLPGQSSSYNQTGVGPVGKYYFGDDRIRPFVFADVLFLYGDGFEGQELGLGAGIMYHLSGNIGLNTVIKYGQILADDDRIDTQNRIHIGIGLSGFIF